MKKKIYLLIPMLSCALLPAVAQTEVSFENEFAEDFYPVWQRSGKYLLDVAEAMPSDLYAYQPSEDVFTFGEQLMHIAANLYWLNATYISGDEVVDLDLDINGKSKVDIISDLREAIAQVDMSYQRLQAGEDDEAVMLFGRVEADKKRVFMLMRDHITHHRGQLVVYLRLNGILPPDYIGW
jgi:uncharacterized damage-inducible protein DinB